MDDSDKETQTAYRVVVNQEEQYSIWPADRANPMGWRDAGKRGSRAECLAYINEVWTDMRPLSLRQHLDGQIPTYRTCERESVPDELEDATSPALLAADGQG